jgi:phage I-like protein
MEAIDYRPVVGMSEKGPRYTVRLVAIAEGLTRIPLALIGRFVKGAQKFAITRQTMADVVANFRRRTADTVIDYEHASEHPEVAGGGPVPAAGWIKAVEDAPDDDGVLWGQAEFTPRAAEHVKNGEYRYLSPVIDWGARDKRTGESQGATLISAALTNRPFLESLPAIAMSDAEWQNEIGRGDADRGRKKTVKVILTDRVAGTARVVADDGTEQTLTVEGWKAQRKVVQLSDVKRDSEGRMDFSSLPQDGDVLIAGDVVRAQQAQHELDAAVGKGIITPAQRPFYERMALSDLVSFRDLVKTMKPVVDLSERGIGGGTETLDDLGKAQVMIETKVQEKLKANTGMQYGEALKLVASENPDLNKRYTQLSRQRMEGRE